MLYLLIELTHNLALLMALSVLSGFIRRPGKHRLREATLLGLLFGATAVIGMLQPVILRPGLIFDGRSIALSLSALFFGPLTAAIASGMALGYRIALGGVGLPMGLLVIVASTAIGLGFHARWVRNKRPLTAGRLLLFGFLVHLAMLLATFTLPAGTAMTILRSLGLPILVGYPLVTLFIGKVLASQEAEAASVELLRKISTAVAQSPVSVLITDTLGTIEYVNPKFTEVTGYTLQEAVGQNPRILKSGDFPAEAYREMWQTIMAGGTWQGEFHNKKKNGEFYWEHASISPVRNALGVISSFVAVKEDITQQKTVEEALRSSEAHYRSLVEGAPGIVYTYHSERGGLYHSARVFDILGYTPDQLDAQPMLWQEAIHPEDAPRVAQCLQEAQEDMPYWVEYRIKDARGQWHWFDDRSTRVRRDGTAIVIEGFVLDITERKQAEQDRLEFEKRILHDHRLESLGVLAGGIAHDFNNILTSVLGNAELISLRLGNDHPLKKNAENILVASRRAKDLVQKIVLFSRRGESEQEPLLASLAMEDIEAQVRKTLPPSLTLRTEVDTQGASVLMDRGEMRQVLMNLCMNAIQAMRGTPDGLLTLTAHRQAGPDQRWVEFVVGDTGVGIQEDARHRIFEPFFTTRGVDEGTGLGLSVVHGIIKRAGGTIEVQSEPGSGTQFHILLPEAPNREPSPQSVAS